MKEKKKSITHILFLAIGIFFSQDSLSQMNQSCETALIICETHSTQSIDFTSDTNECTSSLYYAYDFTNVSGVPIYIHPTPFNNSGTWTLYGPFSGTISSACLQIELGSVASTNGVFSFSSPGSFSNSSTGIYILKLDFNHCSYDENNDPGLFFSLNSYPGPTLDCEEDTELPCQDCITSFSPNAGKYLVSAWVKEEGATMSTTTYANSSIEISYTGDPATTPLTPSGQIIDGWQRIEGIIEVPVAATDIHLSFETSSGTSYYDDIRFHPLDGSMMSYVYDPITLRLMAELDERNYATLYEYDEEGKLIRVKKETEKGIMTIQENRDNIKKQ